MLENSVVAKFATTTQKQQDMENKIEIFISKDNNIEVQVALNKKTCQIQQLYRKYGIAPRLISVVVTGKAKLTEKN